MTRDIELACRCGEVRGVLRDAAPRSVNRIICYCDDCQAYLHHLGRTDLLDEHGGTEIIQVAPSTMELRSGTDQLAAMRLSAKGMTRWYSACCRTPLGNTLSAAVPFIGIPHGLFRGAADEATRDEVFGSPRSRLLARYAIGTPPNPGCSSPGSSAAWGHRIRSTSSGRARRVARRSPSPLTSETRCARCADLRRRRHARCLGRPERKRPPRPCGREGLFPVSAAS
jgi:hypothetical protein